MDLSDEQLVRRAVKHPAGWAPLQPRWSAVGAVFGLGSTSATGLCRRFGFDPDEDKPYPPYDECEAGVCGEHE